MRCTAIVLGLLALAVQPAGGTMGPPLEVDWFTIDGGGTMLTVGGGFELSGTIGQPDAGALTGGGFELYGGFWPGVSGAVLPGDCDGNAALDLNDFAAFSPCMAGPEIGVGANCDCADLDGDLDVDLLDLSLLANEWPAS